MLKLLLKIIKIIFNFFENKKIRKAIFDTSEPNTILFSRGVNENFILQSNDQVIGRTVYATKKPFDFDKLAEKMIWFIENPKYIISMGLESRKIAEDNYDIKIINNKLIEILN